MNRSQKFESYREHGWLKKAFAKLKPAEIEEARKFLADNADLDADAFIMKVQRMYLGRADKPKNWTIINELLSNSCTGGTRG